MKLTWKDWLIILALVLFGWKCFYTPNNKLNRDDCDVTYYTSGAVCE